MKTPLLSFLGALVLTNAASRQAQVQRPALSGRIDAFVAPLNSLDVFDGVILVAHGDSILTQRRYGMASLELNVPVTPSTRFRIASVSKSFTRALVGKLADKGRLGLDDPVSRWIPRFPSAEKITIRQLLDHKAGVPGVNSLPFDEEAIAPNSLAMLVDSIAKMPLEFAPGTSRRYSNGGYAVLARVIEILESTSYASVLKREILDPLGLTETTHESNGEVIRNLAGGYAPSPEKFGVMVRAPFQETETKAGGGSLVSSSRDMLKWVRSIGRSNILRAATWSELFPAANGLIEWSGRSPGFNSYVRYERSSDFTAIVLSNNYSAGMTGEIAEAAIAMAKGLSPAPLPVVAPLRASPDTIAKLAGRYTMPAGELGLPPGTPLVLRVQRGELIAYLGTTPVDVLVPQPSGKFLSRTLWSIVQPVESGIEVRTLYRDHSFRATRMP